MIARTNVGGPAHHVGLLTGRLDPDRYASLLVSGSLGRGEASFDTVIDRFGGRRQVVPELGPELHPGRDAQALRSLVRVMRRYRPAIVHTHTAKAGTLGRIAARVALGPRPVVVHTYHGHVLRRYFGPLKTEVFRTMERALARVSDCLIGVSQTTVDELVDLGIAPRDRFRVVPLGLDLEPYLRLGPDDHGTVFRQELAVADDEILVVYLGRLVPIKRVDVLLNAVASARSDGVRLRLAVVGDGECRASLECLTAELGLQAAVTFTGFRHDLEVVAAATDIAVLSSDAEGTPVSLVEAGAAAKPTVATAVGGVPEIITPHTGVLVEPGHPGALGRELASLALDAERRDRLGAAARAHVRGRYGARRLLDDIDNLYQELLVARYQRDA